MNPTQTRIKSEGVQKEASKVKSPKPTNESALELARAYKALRGLAHRVAHANDKVMKGNENPIGRLGSPAAQANQFSTYSPLMAADLPPAPVPPTKSRTPRRKLRRGRP
jgi:hypothetical protein